MSRVDELSIELAQAILESDEYKDYLSAKAEIRKNPQLYEAVNELRKCSFELQNTAQDNPFDENTKVYDRYSYVRTNEIASRFLNCEIGVCRMIQDVERTLVENIDMNLDFLNN